MTRLLRAVLAFGIALMIGALTAFVIAGVMVTFSVDDTPNWTLGVWMLWVLAWAGILYRYLPKEM